MTDGLDFDSRHERYRTARRSVDRYGSGDVREEVAAGGLVVGGPQKEWLLEATSDALRPLMGERRFGARAIELARSRFQEIGEALLAGDR